MSKNNLLELNSVKDRLKFYIKSKNLTNKKFEDTIGLGNGYVSNMVNTISDKTFETRIKPKFPDLNKLWLLHGEGEMLIGLISNKKNNEEEQLKNTIKNKPHDDQMEILFNEVSDVERKIDRSTATLLARQDIQDRDVVILKKKIDEQNRTLLEIKDMLQMVLKNI